MSWQLTPEQTRNHIAYKALAGELKQDIADRMLVLLEQDPTLEYRELFVAAMRREMPDLVFHASETENRDSILARGLLARDPAEGKRASLGPMGQPLGVYASAEPDTAGMWAGGSLGNRSAVWDIWAITDARSLPHQQDPLNPEHFVILRNVPLERITHCGTASLNPELHHLVLPPR